MLQMIFARRADGSVAPRTPWERDGTPRAPDGVRTFNLSDAVNVFKMSEADLVALYDEFYGDLFLRLQDGEVGTFDPAPENVTRTRRGLLRVVRFPHLSDVDFDAVMTICMERRLDPWRHVVAEARVDGQTGKRELKIIITIDALRSLAEDTGKYKGPTLPYYLDAAGVWHEAVWMDKTRPPVAAKVGIRRKGVAEPIYAVAEWDFYVQYVDTPRGPEIGDFWMRMGPYLLAKCAEALALKKAFPTALGGLLTSDEMRQANNPRPPRTPRPVPANRTDDDVAITDETPASWREFEQVLTDQFKVASAQARKDLIVRLRDAISGHTSPVPKMFFAKAIRALKDYPAEFGLAA